MLALKIVKEITSVPTMGAFRVLDVVQPLSLAANCPVATHGIAMKISSVAQFSCDVIPMTRLWAK